MKIPKGHQVVMPYLIIEEADQFLQFATTIFDAKETYKQLDDERGIVHAEITINGSTIMFAESTEEWSPKTAGLYIYVEDTDATYQKALSQGASSIMEPSDQEYGRAAGIKDPCGNTWWITSIEA